MRDLIAMLLASPETVRQCASDEIRFELLFGLVAMKLTDVQVGLIRGFLRDGHSGNTIVKLMADEGVNITSMTVSRIKNKVRNAKSESPPMPRNAKKPKMTKRQLSTLKTLLFMVNPPSQVQMARRFQVSRSTIQRMITKLGMRLVVKPKCHAISDKTIKKRFERSWKLYMKLKNDNWKKFITSDECLFTVDQLGGQTRVQYISRDQIRSDAEVFTAASHPASVMVWCAMSSRGLLKPVFVKPGVKINSHYYIDNVLKKLPKEAKRLFPDGDYIFHQDSAPAHTAKITLEFLRKNKINFIKPEEWMPSSPDAAPCDFFLWSYVQQKLKAEPVGDKMQLQKSITKVLKRVPQDMINRALKAWPKRCRHIYYRKGRHIENFY